MLSYQRLLISLLLILSGSVSFAQNELVLYKQADTTKLYLEVLKPSNFDSAQTYSAVVFFFGGGWQTGNRSQFLHQAEYLAERGMVCFLADYRIETKHHTTPFESLKDAKSAMRFVRKNAKQFSTDPNQIVAAGASAGGHLAAATAMIDGFNDASDDLSISSKPNAMLLFNPVIDNGPAGYGFERIDAAYKEFSPLHNIRTGLPPTLFLIGTKDHLIPLETAEYFTVSMKRAGNICELKLHEGVGHGFFNYKNTENFQKTMLETVEFLKSIEILK